MFPGDAWPKEVTMKKLLMVFLVVAAVVLAGSTLLWAPDPPSEPGPECSPGFWKNHTSIWNPDLCAGQGDCEQLAVELKAKGKGSGTVRHTAASELNSRYLATYGAPLPCNE
jgi:hypothetical protein